MDLQDGIRPKFEGKYYINKAKTEIANHGFICLSEHFRIENLDKNDLDKITTKMCESGEYFQDINAHTQKWVIKKNPSYELSQSALRTNTFIVLTFIAIAVSAIYQGCTYYLDKSKDKVPMLLKAQDSLIQRTKSLQDSIIYLHNASPKNVSNDTNSVK
jgi:hypothetical protein